MNQTINIKPKPLSWEKHHIFKNDFKEIAVVVTTIYFIGDRITNKK